MTAQLLKGDFVAASIKSRIIETVTQRNMQGLRPPCLAVVLVGEDAASQIYVNNKRKACGEVGFQSEAYILADTISEQSLLQLIEELNQKETVDGILVQLPLPAHINTVRIIESILPAKDVDGFHPYNVGRLAQRAPILRPCTPYGIIQLLHAYQLHIRGRHAVVVGASNIVGRPMMLEFLLAGATVTICHRFTKNLEHYVRMAEIIVIATGVCDVIDPAWLSKDQIVVDVGIHRLASGKLRGDLDFLKAQERVAWITPVPGGVGPLTVATLLQNTLQAAVGSKTYFQTKY